MGTVRAVPQFEIWKFRNLEIDSLIIYSATAGKSVLLLGFINPGSPGAGREQVSCFHSHSINKTDQNRFAEGVFRVSSSNSSSGDALRSPTF